MSKQINWQLLTIEELAALIVSFGSDTALLRARKAYYKRTDNQIMSKRIMVAQLLADNAKHID